MQKFKDIDGNDARYILALAAENSNSFENVLIDETLDTPDDCIIKYCADNKDRVTLLTSDKTMALKARMYAVQVKYFKQTKNSSTNTMPRINYPTNSKIRTLIPASRIGNQLLISNFHTHNMSICVCSNGLEYTDGIKELKVGDDVFIATKRQIISHLHTIEWCRYMLKITVNLCTLKDFTIIAILMFQKLHISHF